MAYDLIRGEGRRVTPARIPEIRRVLTCYDRETLGTVITVAIDLLDVFDGDPDVEDATDAEDDFSLSAEALEDADCGPGCVVSEPKEMSGDEDDFAWAEWQSLPAAPRRAGRIEGRVKDGWLNYLHEDAEDDDPDTGVEDGPFDPEEDRCPAGDDGCGPLVIEGRIR